MVQTDDPSELRLVQGVRLADRRRIELEGILQGLAWSRAPDAGMTRLAWWLEQAEELHEREEVHRLRECLAPTLDRRIALAKRLRTAHRVRTTLDAGGRAHEPHRAHVRYDDPPPLVEFPGRCFVFTGILAGCERKIAYDATRALGAEVYPRMVRRADYLVVGAIASPGWLSSRRGRKIETAERWREHERTKCRIVREASWVQGLHRSVETLNEDEERT